RKLLISSGSMSNVKNRLQYEDIIRHLPGNDKFLYVPLSTFDNESIIRFVESAGVPLKEEDHGRMFTVSDKAKYVLDVFTEVLEQNNVEVRINTVVSDLLSKEGSVTGCTLVDGTELSSGHVIITIGRRTAH